MKSKLTKGIVLNLSSNEDVYRRGEKYYRLGKLKNYQVITDRDGTDTAVATVEGNYKNYAVSATVDADGSVQNYSCTCESYSIWRGACKHVVAVLFAFMENADANRMNFMARNKTKALTDDLERLIFDGIAHENNASELADSQKVKLIPMLHYLGRQETFLTFTVGQSRMYVVKNVSSFASSVNGGNTVSYGRGLSFRHTRSAFDDESKPLLDFLLKEESLYSEVARQLNGGYMSGYRSGPDARSLALTERNMDEFFEILNGREIDARLDSDARVKLCDGLPPVRFTIDHNETGTKLTSTPFRLRVINGKKFSYFISNTQMNRTPRRDAQIVTKLLSAMAENRMPEILFTENEQLRFMSTVMPRLKRMTLVTSETGEPPLYVPSELKTRLYLDSERNDVKAWPEFRYDGVVINPFLNDGADQILRDRAGEYEVRQRLLSHGFKEAPVKKAYLLSGNDSIFNFLHGKDAGIESFRPLAEIMVSDALQDKTAKMATPSVGVRLAGNLLELTVSDTGYSMSELMEALESYQARKKFHRLKNGRFIALEDGEMSSVEGLLDALDLNRKDVKGNAVSLPAYRALYMDEVTKALPNVKTDAPYQKLIESFQNNEILGFTVPESLDGVLREYQKTGFMWLSTLTGYGFGGILADDMGLGKTLQVISLLLSQKGENVRSLVVAPTSLLYNWENEIKKFAPALTAQVVTGLPAARRELITNSEADVLITTYDMMKRDTEAYDTKSFEFVIADEAQNIKNPSTQNAKAIKDIKSRVRFALTGTPIENTLTELWSIFDFIMPGYLFSSHKFQKTYEQPIVKNDDREKAERLRKQISPFVLRRTKRGVLTELPEKTETTLPAELTDEQKRFYQANLAVARGEIESLSEGADNRIRILAMLTRLRQICCHPALFLSDYNGGSGKLDLALETIQMAIESGHRILLFSQFTSMLAILKTALDNSPYKYFYLDGASKAADRMDMTSRFNAGERDLFLISLKAGGTGLNLTGADVVIHYDPWWNPSVMDQASDRAHRYGQEKAVQIFNLVAKDTIEEKIMELQEKKRGLIDAVVTEGGSFINALSEEEIRALFSDTAK